MKFALARTGEINGNRGRSRIEVWLSICSPFYLGCYHLRSNGRRSSPCARQDRSAVGHNGIGSGCAGRGSTPRANPNPTRGRSSTARGASAAPSRARDRTVGPGMIGLTLGYSIFIVRGHMGRRLVSHECRHVYQYETHGSIAAFLPVYLQQIATVGYQNAKLSRMHVHTKSRSPDPRYGECLLQLSMNLLFAPRP